MKNYKATLQWDLKKVICFSKKSNNYLQMCQKGTPRQLFWATFLRVCIRTLNFYTHPVCEAGFSTTFHIAVKQKSKNRLDVDNDMGLILTNAPLRISRLSAQMQSPVVPLISMSAIYYANECKFSDRNM